MEVSGQLRASAALPTGREPPVPVGYEVVWTPETVWTLEGEQIFYLPGIEPL
jgi:hypothetical protein